MHESNEVFKKEHDEQLLLWLNRRPEDWTLSWGGSGTIYGWGHNHRGQLGGVEGAKVRRGFGDVVLYDSCVSMKGSVCPSERPSVRLFVGRICD